MTKYNYIKPLLLLFVVAFFVQFFTQNTSAATQRLDLTASPPILNLTAVPGSVIKDKIRLRNNSTSTLNLKAELRKLESKNEQGEALIGNLDNADEISSMITFDSPSFQALPGEYTNVSYTISIPESAVFGYYVAFYITSEQDKSVSAGPDTPQVTGAIAIPVLLKIKRDGAKAEAKIVEFKSKNFLNEYLPVEFTTRVTNTGNIHINPRGNIFIKSGSKDIATLEVNPGSGNILPETIRNFESNWDDGFMVRKPVVEDGNVKMDSDGKPVTKLQINWNKLSSLRIGHYTASIVLVYNDGVRDIPIEGVTSFWVIPYKILIGTVIGIIVFVLFIRMMIKSYVKKQIKKYKTSP